MIRCRPLRIAAFTLVELSLVLVVFSLLSATALRYSTARSNTTNANTTNATLDAVDAALLNYRIAYGRLPCPADITAAENTGNFGIEKDTVGAGSGTCTGANITATNFAAGSIPTKTLRLADKYAYDAWGRKIEYGVDTRMTFTNSFMIYPIYYYTATAAFSVKNSYGVTLTPGFFYPVYVLISYGKNGHGGFVRNVNTSCTLSTCPIFNYGSQNSDELANCNCNSSASVGATFSSTPTFVQDTPNIINGGTYSYMFDDIVRFKARSQLATMGELQ